MLKLTMQNGKPVWFRAESIDVVESCEANGCATTITTGEQMTYVREGPDEVAAMIARAEQERLRDTFVAGALTGLAANPHAWAEKSPREWVQLAMNLADNSLQTRGNVTAASAEQSERERQVEAQREGESAKALREFAQAAREFGAAAMGGVVEAVRSTPVPFCSCGKCDPADPASPTCFPF